MIRTWVTAGALALGIVPGAGRAELSVAEVYFFGNSLVHHLSEQSKLTNVPHWMNELAKADGRSFGVDGQWGFLRNFSDGLPPTANWSFEGVQGVWGPSQGSFGDAGFDAVVVTPANFIQYQLPDVPYEGDNPSGETPLGAMQKLFDWVHEESPESALYVYEGWAEMDGITGRFPPRERAFETYHEVNRGDYHQWYLDLIGMLEVTRPDYQVELIPVASVLAGLMAEGGPLADVPPADLYEDSAPHGTASLYFLAAMVTYAWIYEVPPPEGYRPPATLLPEVVENYAEIARLIWAAAPEREALAPAETGGAEAVVEEAEVAAADLPERGAVILPPAGIRPDGVPSLGMGLNGIADWSTQHPFVDMMKSARGWVGHTAEGWGAISTVELRAGGYLDENDWPVRVPEEATALEAVLLTDQNPDQSWLRGSYVLRYEGTGELKLSGRAKRVRYDEHEVGFFYEPGEGVVGVRITETSADDPIRNISVVKEELVPLWEAGALFNPLFLDTIQDVREIRFMDWMMTNGSPVMTWEDRPVMELSTWSEWGVPLEVMIRLANVIGADPWFTMPHQADDAYVRQFAEMVERDLDPGLKAYVEYSNEVWNQIFPQAVYAREQATTLWGESEMGWMQWYGLRSAQVMDIWTEVYGDAAQDRLVRVAATHTGWPGLEENILVAPLAYLALGKKPVESFDAYAVTGYFGYEMGTEEMARRMDGWLDQSEELATKAGEAEGLRRVALREFVKDARFEGAIAPVAKALEEGSLSQLVNEVFPYHADAAMKYDLTLVMYEGGTHVAGHGARVNDERLTAFFREFNYTPEMAKLYEILMGGWAAAGGTLFNAFVDVAPATQWGSWGALRHLEDSNPRWDMLMAYNASGPQWETRDPVVFEDGIRALGSGSDERVEGTAAEDYLVALGGDDIILTGGGADVVHGGSGRDVVVLPLPQESYEFQQVGDRLEATGPDGTIRMAGVEVLRFEVENGPDMAVERLGG